MTADQDPEARAVEDLIRMHFAAAARLLRENGRTSMTLELVVEGQTITITAEAEKKPT